MAVVFAATIELVLVVHSKLLACIKENTQQNAEGLSTHRASVLSGSSRKSALVIDQRLALSVEDVFSYDPIISNAISLARGLDQN